MKCDGLCLEYTFCELSNVMVFNYNELSNVMSFGRNELFAHDISMDLSYVVHYRAHHYQCLLLSDDKSINHVLLPAVRVTINTYLWM